MHSAQKQLHRLCNVLYRALVFAIVILVAGCIKLSTPVRLATEYYIAWNKIIV